MAATDPNHPSVRSFGALPQPAGPISFASIGLSPSGAFPAPNSESGQPIGTAMLYEDDQIRIWENRMPAGCLGTRHSHDNDYWLMTALGDKAGKQLTVKRDGNGAWTPFPQRVRTGDLLYIKGHREEETADSEPDASMVVFYLCEMKGTAAEPGGAGKAPSAGWGASAGVLFENSEVKVWDLRVPVGQRGSVPISPDSRGVFHVDASGQRKGAMPVSEVKSSATTMGASYGQKKFGNIYFRNPLESSPAAQEGEARAGEASNDGQEPYRGIIYELKAGEPVITAKL